MDIKTAIAELAALIREDDGNPDIALEIYRKCDDIRRWLNRGGFVPQLDALELGTIITFVQGSMCVNPRLKSVLNYK